MTARDDVRFRSRHEDQAAAGHTALGFGEFGIVDGPDVEAEICQQTARLRKGRGINEESELTANPKKVCRYDTLDDGSLAEWPTERHDSLSYLW